MSTLPLNLSHLFGITFIAFGLNCLFRPQSALSFFKLSYPPASTFTSPAHHAYTTSLIDALQVVYGIRDVFIGVVICIVAWFAGEGSGRGEGRGRERERGDGRESGGKVVGWVLVAAGVVAGCDGVVCWVLVGEGEWAHWGYAPFLGLLGGWLIVGGRR